MADPLIKHRYYLCNQAKTIDCKLKLQAALELTLVNEIPMPGGGRASYGLKANAGKKQLIRIRIST